MESAKSTSNQDEVNLKLYRRAEVVQTYTPVNLYPAEAIALVRYREDFQRRRVLDLGCGAGRLTTYLLPLTDQYLGVDFSPHMIAHCTQKFPGVSFSQGDMRDLSRFDTGSIHAVIAINNLFDAVSHEDRLRVLAEIRRVLAPDGLLLFSAHNRNCLEGRSAPRLHFSLNPGTQLRNIVNYARSVANHRRIKPKERLEADYALLNDRAHYYSVLHYYILRQVQIAQLESAGFRLVECLDHLGRTLGRDDDDSTCPSVYYIARPQA